MKRAGRLGRVVVVATLLSVFTGGCAAPPQQPATSAAKKRKPAPAAVEVSDETVCDAEAYKTLRVSAGTPPPEEELGPLVEVVVEGIAGESDEIRAMLRSRPGELIDPDKVAADIEALWASGRFEDVSVVARTSKQGTTLAFVLLPRPKMGKLFFRGIHNLGSSVVDGAVRLRANEPFMAQRLTHTVARLREAYAAAGYLHASVDARQLRAGGALHLCLVVQEGAKVTIDPWRIEGANSLSQEQLLGLRDTRHGTVNVTGGIYRPEIWSGDALRILAHYYDTGHLFAKVAAPDLQLSKDKRKLAITIRIEEGAVFRVGKITFSGEALTEGRDYASVVTTKPGEIFSRTKVAEDLTRIREFHETKGSWTPQFEVTPLTQLDTDKSLVHIEFELR